MNTHFASVFYLLGLLTPLQAELRHSAIIEEIEAGIELPLDAKLIQEYSRNYALDEDGVISENKGMIVATYLATDQFLYGDRTRKRCEGSSKVSDPKYCSEEYLNSVDRSDARIVKRFGTTGQSRWINDVNHLPWISDGKCLQVTIIYDPAAKQFLSVRCNGMG